MIYLYIKFFEIININRPFKVNFILRIYKLKINERSTGNGFRRESRQKSRFFESKV
jgi:hypothetical protein